MSDGSRTSRKSNSPQKPVFNSDIRVGETISRKETTIKVGELKLSTHPGSRGRLPPTPGRSPLSTPSRRPRNSPLGMRRRSPSPFHSSDFSARSGPRQTGTAPPMLVPGSSTVRTSTPYTDNTTPAGVIMEMGPPLMMVPSQEEYFQQPPPEVPTIYGTLSQPPIHVEPQKLQLVESPRIPVQVPVTPISVVQEPHPDMARKKIQENHYSSIRQLLRASICLLLLLVLIASAAAVFAIFIWVGEPMAPIREQKTWHYAARSSSSKYGPSEWHRVNSDWQSCRSGKGQSPIDITSAGAVTGKGKLPLSTDFQDVGSLVTAENTFFNKVALTNDGYGIVGDKIQGFFKFEGGWFQLKHVNIHQPSEHRIDGKAADVEMQFLHQGFDNQFLTLSGRNESVRVGAEEREIEKVLVKAHTDNQDTPGYFRDVFEKIPGQGSTTAASFNYRSMISALSDSSGVTTATSATGGLEYYTYKGSLTRPPCTEGHTWVIAKRELRISSSHLTSLKTAIGYENVRPLQRIEGRTIGAS